MNQNETIEKPIEAKPESPKPVEVPETEIIQAAQMLEEPPSGSFMHALHTFVAWVNSLIGK